MTLHADASLDAVIFDLDGTLVDTAPEFISIVQGMRKRHDLLPLPEEDIRQTVTNGGAALVSLALEVAVEHPEFEHHREQFLLEYEQALGKEAVVYPGLRELIRRLGEKQIPWGVATNKFRRYAEPLMAALDFSPAAQCLITPTEVAHPKPDPESILLSCTALGGRPSQCVYVGDHQRDIQAGKAAGCQTIAAAYGYIERGVDPRDWQADYLVESSEELSQLLMRMI